MIVLKILGFVLLLPITLAIDIAINMIVCMFQGIASIFSGGNAFDNVDGLGFHVTEGLFEGIFSA
jgi:hypothetical protein